MSKHFSHFTNTLKFTVQIDSGKDGLIGKDAKNKWDVNEHCLSYDSDSAFEADTTLGNAVQCVSLPSLACSLNYYVLSLTRLLLKCALGDCSFYWIE